MQIGQDETMQGLGCPGGCQGADGRLYEWVQGIDGLGTPVGFWRAKSGAPPAAPYVRNRAPFLGDVAQAADGQLYQWVEGVDGLGNAFGFWKRFKRLAQRALPIAQRLAPFVPGASAALTAATPLLKHAGIAGLGEVGALYAAEDGSLYQVQGIDDPQDIEGLGADEELSGLSDDELGGLEADDELSGFGAGDDLDGFADADELQGMDADADDLQGIGAEAELEGLAEDPLAGIHADELDGFAASDDLEGLSEVELQGSGDGEAAMSGYLPDPGMSGVEGYVPDGPPRTPMFAPAPDAPMWAPLW
ncbi:MAG: hypothetical protein ABW221_22600 [Vicinamibacteria bacterium]